jgi:hypothetical protein
MKVSRSQLEPENRPEARIPAPIFLGWSARFFLVGNMLLVWFGRWLMYGRWPGALKLCLCTIMGIADVISAAAAWRRTAKWHQTTAGAHPSLVRLVVPATHAVGFVVMLSAQNAFMTWVICGPPQVR